MGFSLITPREGTQMRHRENADGWPDTQGTADSRLGDNLCRSDQERRMEPMDKAKCTQRDSH